MYWVKMKLEEISYPIVFNKCKKAHVLVTKPSEERSDLAVLSQPNMFYFVLWAIGEGQTF